MSIIDEDGNTVLKMSFLWKLGAIMLIALISAQTGLLFTWGVWITSEVQKNKTDIAVMQSGISTIQSRVNGAASQIGMVPKKVVTALKAQSDDE
jgi:hypothetical protein